MPTYGTYFGELLTEREDPFYQVSLTVEGHACQHDILHRAFRHPMDDVVRRALVGQATHKEICKEASRLGGSNGTPHPDQVKEMQKKAWKATSKEVILTNITTGEETTYPSLHEAARSINGAASALCLVIKGNRKTHKGHTARYVRTLRRPSPARLVQRRNWLVKKTSNF